MKKYFMPINLHLSRRKMIITGTAFGLLLLMILPCVRYGVFLAVPAGSGRNVRVFDVAGGATLKKIAADLEKSGIISSKRLFVAYAWFKDGENAVKAGVYLFDDGMPPPVILRKLLDGDVYIRRFAVPEGYSIYQIAELLERRGIFRRDEFLKQCADPALLAELGIEASSVEGYLCPRTYDISPNKTPADLIREMVAQFDKQFQREFEARAKSISLSAKEILTLASMVEKEAVVPHERPLIASVFLNRLKKGMPLQSDPTAVYKVRAFAGKITKKDIMLDSPYNTYKVPGLPPGPIGNPGKDSIEAVLNPATTNYLYFVARMDGNHHFSATLEEHNRAVHKYLRSRQVPEEARDIRPAGRPG